MAESTLQVVGSDQLVLQLPGEQDPSQAARVLGSTALLEFRAQKPGTEKEMQGLLALKRQAERCCAPSSAPATAASRRSRPAPRQRCPAEELAEALTSLGVQVPAGSR